MFVTVNCGSISEQLLESELFAHVKGAFTGAVAHREGRFTLADGGTLFLDEIGDMSPNLQVKLLRVLQDRTFEPVGSSKSQRVDVRVIAATNQDLPVAIREKRFREDLYYRLNVIPIVAPPLRERADDVPLLVHHFLDRVNAARPKPVGISSQALERLCAHGWPGNVRELENLIERLVVLLGEGDVEIDDLPESMRGIAQSTSPPLPDLPEAGVVLNDRVRDLERSLIRQVLVRTGWNKNRAAQLLGLQRTTLLEKLKKLGLEAPDSDSTGE